MNPIKHPYWRHFQAWAISQNVGMEHEDDWLAWWQCWLDGFGTAQTTYGRPDGTLENRGRDE